MYNRRTKGDPLWNSLVLGGFKDGERCAMLTPAEAVSRDEHI